MNLKTFHFDKSWSLFLDRDGVINKKIEGDYVRTWSQFEFLPGVIEALKILRKIFGRIIIITNQRGIGRGLMTEEDLKLIHTKMCEVLGKNGIKIDKIYFCPHDYEKEECNCRKPKGGMVLKAKLEFPDINLRKSVIIGDSESDIELGVNLGMIPVYITKEVPNKLNINPILKFYSLWDFARCLK